MRAKVLGKTVPVHNVIKVPEKFRGYSPPINHNANLHKINLKKGL
jgi:hypothetical protein